MLPISFVGAHVFSIMYVIHTHVVQLLQCIVITVMYYELCVILYYALTDPGKCPSSLWKKSLSLSVHQKTLLQEGEWLDDLIINAAQKLLRRQFPRVRGLQDTTAIVSNKGIVLPSGAIQILHIRSNHWVCLQVNADRSAVHFYDSLYSTIPTTVADHIIDLVHSDKPRLKILTMNMQVQEGGKDCGLFAIAVATSLCFGEDPTTLTYNQERMRHHLLSCFDKQKITLFPKKEENVERGESVKKIALFALHCICRRPRKRREAMRQCTKCLQWYHSVCLSIPKQLMVAGASWTCSVCK